MQGSGWRQEKEIGRGAFGIVTLWAHRTTNDRIVIKQVWIQELHIRKFKFIFFPYLFDNICDIKCIIILNISNTESKSVVPAFLNPQFHAFSLNLTYMQVNGQQRLDNDTRQKWDNEIRLMNTMQHKNIVKGKPVPDEIKRIVNNPVDLLGLEVCDRDLRKVRSDCNRIK